MKKQDWLLYAGMGISGALATLSLARGAVPQGQLSQGQVTDDTAIYQNLSDIKAPRQNKLNFDSDIQNLSQKESRFRERLPSLTAKRASKAQYRAGLRQSR